jgi:hypothetical protein
MPRARALACARDKRSHIMLETLPGLLLVIMIAITLILLPRLSDERPGGTDKPRQTEKPPINPKRDT